MGGLLFQFLKGYHFCREAIASHFYVDPAFGITYKEGLTALISLIASHANSCEILQKHFPGAKLVGGSGVGEGDMKILVNGKLMVLDVKDVALSKVFNCFGLENQMNRKINKWDGNVNVIPVKGYA